MAYHPAGAMKEVILLASHRDFNTDKTSITMPVEKLIKRETAVGLLR